MSRQARPLGLWPCVSAPRLPPFKTTTFSSTILAVNIIRSGIKKSPAEFPNTSDERERCFRFKTCEEEKLGKTEKNGEQAGARSALLEASASVPPGSLSGDAHSPTKYRGLPSDHCRPAAPRAGPPSGVERQGPGQLPQGSPRLLSPGRPGRGPRARAKPLGWQEA